MTLNETPERSVVADRPMVLEAHALSAGYGSFPVVNDLSLRLRAGEVVSLLGANGAGKTTALLALCGEVRASAGTVHWFGQTVTPTLWKLARQGLALVTEERSVFMRMSVRENLRVGNCDTDLALSLFPELEPRLSVHAGLLSGGEQQMLALAGALSRRPKVLLADELSLGLAPLVAQRLLKAVKEAARTGVGALIVEQHARLALGYADRAYIMDRGRIVSEGSASAILADIAQVEATYLGGPPIDAKPVADQPMRHK